MSEKAKDTLHLGMIAKIDISGYVRNQMKIFRVIQPTSWSL
jgi:hypothetical protein